MKSSSSFARLAFALALAVPVMLGAQAGRPGGAAQPAAPPTPLGPDAPFTVAVATAVVEAAPVYMAKEGPYGQNFQFINGGVRTLPNNGAHAAGNATTQMLVVIRDNPKVRLLFTLVEGLYRIVGKRSSGINTARRSQGQARRRAAQHVGATITWWQCCARRGCRSRTSRIVSAPATGMAAALAKGEADAISMWEPESQNAVEALGKDAVIFQNNKIYREFYSMYSTTDVLNDPAAPDAARRVRARDQHDDQRAEEESEAVLRR